VKEGLRVVGFVVAILLFFVWAGRAVTDVSGEGQTVAMSADASSSNGRALFFGAGMCATCHAFGSEGSAVRCPDLGASPSLGAAIGVRAAGRVEGQGAIEYLVQSMYEPDAFVVEGYPAGLMRPAHRAPTALSDEAITSLALFLLEASGVFVEVDEVLRAQRPFAERAATEPDVAPGLALPSGDAQVGRDVYLSIKCWSCHAIDGLALPDEAPREDAVVGPDLSAIAAIQTREYLLESMVDPDAVVVADPADIEPGSDASYRTLDGSSRMPDFLDSLTFREVLDLVAYLETLDGASTSGGDD
jgi:mono/diheme cytochrome c family protein